MALPVFRLQQGKHPLILSVPHAGIALSESLHERLTTSGRALVDTDWYVDELYDFAAKEGVTTLCANYSRYVVDLNRPADDTPLYLQSSSQCLPLASFAGAPLYLPNAQPTMAERTQRLVDYWWPYHNALGDELLRLRALHGHVIVLDAHSIAGEIPRLFAGRLPSLNLGTNDGTSCSQRIGDKFVQWARQSGYDYVCNDRFKGGYITRHYGRPDLGWHAMQLEINQDAYLAAAGETASQRQRDNARWISLQAQLQNLIASLKLLRPQELSG